MARYDRYSGIFNIGTGALLGGMGFTLLIGHRPNTPYYHTEVLTSYAMTTGEQRRGAGNNNFNTPLS